MLIRALTVSEATLRRLTIDPPLGMRDIDTHPEREPAAYGFGPKGHGSRPDPFYIDNVLACRSRP